MVINFKKPEATEFSCKLFSQRFIRTKKRNFKLFRLSMKREGECFLYPSISTIRLYHYIFRYFHTT